MKLRISDVFELYDGGDSGISDASAERITEMTLKRIHEDTRDNARSKISRPLKFALLAAAAIALILGSAMAVAISSMPSEADALRMANRELHALKDMGILTGDFQLPVEGCQIRLEGDVDNADNLWLKLWGRTFNPFYYISYYDSESAITVSVDTQSGKLTGWNIIAYADEDDIPVMTRTNENGQVINWYDNYGDIFGAGMTVDGLCEKLCEYWGFSGYTIGETATDYGETYAPVDGKALLKDAAGKPWITVYFEGDQKGVPQYIEIHPMGNGALMMVGYAHALG